MTETPTDAHLIQRLCAGDLSALGDLYDKHHLQVFRTAMSITHDHQTAEDILQECFLKLNVYARRIDTSLPLEPWLYRVTVNLAYTWVTRHSHRWLTSIEDVIDRLIAPAWTNSEQRAEVSEMQGVIRQAIAALPATQQLTVILYYLNDLSLKEIAYILECPIGTVKSRLFYGREYLKHCLQDYRPLAQQFKSAAQNGN
jgi:RNA polymerase sigma-70 factor (ECF subfamily)